MPALFSGYSPYPSSVVETARTRYWMVRGSGGTRFLHIEGNTRGFQVEDRRGNTALCPLTADNARLMRSRLDWLNPVPLGLRGSFGFGDRLGLATVGHIHAIRNTGITPIFAQQSVRENARTGRSPQQVVDDAMWGIFQEGWRKPWGADADHLKTPDDITEFVKAGYSFFTFDPGEHIESLPQDIDQAALTDRFNQLPWELLLSSPTGMRAAYLNQTFQFERIQISFDERTLLEAAVKYEKAIVHLGRMHTTLRNRLGNRPADVEISIDETDVPTTPLEHYFIASELTRLGVHWVSLAPRFAGSFEKGVDFQGDLEAFKKDLPAHAAIQKHFGTYKLSLHSGSDKFSIYPLLAQHVGGKFHVKTAGTSYLEALRVVAQKDLLMFRQMLGLACIRYEQDRQSYHVSASQEKIPDTSKMPDSELVNLLDQFDVRQVLHVTFGSILQAHGAELHTLLQQHENEYSLALTIHFKRHLTPFILKQDTVRNLETDPSGQD
jgi:hypothetical protein